MTEDQINKIEAIDIIKDMDGRLIQSGHIVAVRYVWNSYVGVATSKGLINTSTLRFAFIGLHSYSFSATYQILGHISKSHVDYSEDVFNWFNSEDGSCPVKIKVYEALEAEQAAEDVIKNQENNINK